MTDVVMTLYSPAGILVAQADASGVERNSKIAANLSPGMHTVQVRHYNTSNGTGSYGIRVSKGSPADRHVAPAHPRVLRHSPTLRSPVRHATPPHATSAPRPPVPDAP